MRKKWIDAVGGIHRQHDDQSEGGVLVYDVNTFLSNFLTLVVNATTLRMPDGQPGDDMVAVMKALPISLFVKPHVAVDPASPDIAMSKITPYFTNAVQGTLAPFGEPSDSVYASLYRSAVRAATESLNVRAPTAMIRDIVQNALTVSGTGTVTNRAGYAMLNARPVVKTNLVFDPDLWVLHAEVDGSAGKNVIGGKAIGQVGLLNKSYLSHLPADRKVDELIGSTAFGLLLLALDWPHIPPEMFSVEPNDPELGGVDLRTDDGKLRRAKILLNRFTQFILMYKYQGHIMSIRMQERWFQSATSGYGKSAARSEAIMNVTSAWQDEPLHPICSAIVRLFTSSTCKLPTGGGPAWLLPKFGSASRKDILSALGTGFASNADEATNFMSRVHPLSRYLLRYEAELLPASGPERLRDRVGAVVDAAEMWRARRDAIKPTFEHVRKHLPWGWSIPLNGHEFDLTGPNLGMTDGRGFSHDPMDAVIGRRFFVPWSLRAAFIKDGLKENVPNARYQVVPMPERIRVSNNPAATISRGASPSFIAKFSWFGEGDCFPVTVDAALFELSAVANVDSANRDEMMPYLQRSLSPRDLSPSYKVMRDGLRFKADVPQDSTPPWSGAAEGPEGNSLMLQNWPLRTVNTDTTVAVDPASTALTNMSLADDRSVELVMRAAAQDEPFLARVPLIIDNATGPDAYLPVVGDLVLAVDETLQMRRENDDFPPMAGFAARALVDMVEPLIPQAPLSHSPHSFTVASSAKGAPRFAKKGELPVVHQEGSVDPGGSEEESGEGGGA